MKSQSNSQELTAGEIIGKFGLDASLWGALPDKYPKPKDPTPELLQRALSCLPEKRDLPTDFPEIAMDYSHISFTAVNQSLGFNAAIDTMEQNILTKFGG